MYELSFIMALKISYFIRFKVAEEAWPSSKTIFTFGQS